MKTHVGRDQKGRQAFTLMEIAIVLGVISAIVGGIWWAASNAGELSKENNALTQLQTVTQNVNNLMQGQTLSGTTTDLTYQFIQTGAIPSLYIDASNNQKADNPWAVKSFIVWGSTQSNKKYFRVAFYNTSFKGCVALLLQGTSCQVGQVGCPVAVWTNGTTSAPALVDECVPSQNNCPSTSPTFTSASGWQAIGVSSATAMCAANNGAGSVEFEYSL